MTRWAGRPAYLTDQPFVAVNKLFIAFERPSIESFSFEALKLNER
jgi:hypothetical protein